MKTHAIVFFGVCVCVCAFVRVLKLLKVYIFHFDM